MVFSAIYLLAIYSYIRNEPLEFAVFLTFWVIFITGSAIEGMVVWLPGVLGRKPDTRGSYKLVGDVQSCENSPSIQC